MSDTQQEIATPEVCKQRKRSVLLTVFALIFVIMAVTGFILLHKNTVAVLVIVIALAIVLSIIAILSVKGNRIAIKIILDYLTGIVALCIIAYLYVTMNEDKKADTILYMAITVAMAVLLICLNLVKQYEDEKDSTRSTRYLTYTATFVALSYIFKMLGNAVSSIIVIPNMKLSFVYIPWVISGVVLGPVGGVVTALISDILGQLTITVGGAINPLTSIANALFPLAPALIYKFMKKSPDWLKLLIGMAISLVICTMGIGAYSLYTYYNYGSSMSFWTYLLTIRSPQMIVIAINYTLCLALLPVVKKIRLTERLRQAEE